MLFEEEKLIPSEKETKLQIYINKLIYELHNNKKTEVDSKKLLELLSYLTSDENISSSMKTATECCNRNITDILHKKEVDKLKNEIKYMEKNYIPKQKVIEEIDKVLEAFRKVEFNRVTSWNSLVQLKENLLGDK